MNSAKRLYQRKDGAIVSGLCRGIADYVQTDVKYVRALWVGLSLCIGVHTISIYCVLMFIVPYAQSTERSTALLDAEVLKRLLRQGDFQALRQYLVELWPQVLRRWKDATAAV